MLQKCKIENGVMNERKYYILYFILYFILLYIILYKILYNRECDGKGRVKGRF